MGYSIDFGALARLVRGTRGNRGLREAAELIGGISPSTLSRIEGQRMEDMNVSTFLRVCEWIETDPADLILGSGKQQGDGEDTITAVQTQLRAAQDIDPRTAQILADMVRGAYDAAKQGQGDG